MVISVRGQNVLDGSKFLYGGLSLLGEGRRGDDPDVARGELDSGRTTAHWKPSEEPGKGLREGNEFGGDLCRVWVVIYGPERIQRHGINTSRMTISVICVGGGGSKPEVAGKRYEGTRRGSAVGGRFVWTSGFIVCPSCWTSASLQLT